MNLSIFSTTKSSLLTYQMEVQASTSYFDTTLFIKGEFGVIKLQKIDLPDCHIWMGSYQLSEAVMIKGISEVPILQLYVPLRNTFEDPFKNLEEHQNGQGTVPVHCSYSSEPLFVMETHCNKCLVVHYGTSYFSVDQTSMLESLSQQPASPSSIDTSHKVIPDPSLLHVLQQIDAYPVEDAYLPRYMKAKAEELLVHFLKHLELYLHAQQQFSAQEKKWLQQAMTILKEEPEERFTHFQLAKRTGMNAYTLKKKFKLFTGYTIPEFQLKMRMEKAGQLLVETDLPITDIAQQIGYKNLPNFSETFKKYFGTSPRTHRKKHH